MMILDTHVLIWLDEGNPRLRKSTGAKTIFLEFNEFLCLYHI
jgi:PIN domain nuclease of toxin-antitoxin system